MTPHQQAVLSVQRARYTRGNFKRIITVSKLVQSQICKRYGLAPEEVEVVHNGIDLERFHPRNISRHRASVRRELGLDDEVPVVLFVANAPGRNAGVLPGTAILTEYWRFTTKFAP